MIRLSHSSKDTYLLCSEKWRLHYQERLRPTSIGSALFFGSAVDDAMGRLLLTKKKEYTEDEKATLDKSAIDIFIDGMTQVNINGELIDIRLSPRAQYYKSDIDLSILDDDSFSKITNIASEYALDLPTNDHIYQFVDEYQNLLKNKIKPEVNETCIYNYLCWLSLYHKGLMILEEYNKTIIPQIEEVFSIQEKVELKDGDDLLIGYIDFVASFVDEPGKKYVCDNKTSSRPYKDDSVRTSEQLSTYAEYKGIYNCAYVVAEKKIRKRKPQVRINIIRDMIPDKQIDDTFDKITGVFYGIQGKEFTKDFDSCYAFGKPCPYFDYCRKGDKTGLIKLWLK